MSIDQSILAKVSAEKQHSAQQILERYEKTTREIQQNYTNVRSLLENQKAMIYREWSEGMDKAKAQAEAEIQAL